MIVRGTNRASISSSASGVIEAMTSLGLNQKIALVGFDSSVFLLQSLRSGNIDGLIVQDPYRMGYLGVTTAVKHLRGEKVEAAVDTGCVLVTKENRHTPEVEAVVGK